MTLPTTPEGQPTFVAPRPKSVRLKYIDVVRGLAIVSMLTLHLSETSKLAAITHPFVVVDGAHGFVVLAGFVLGIVEGRRVARNDPLTVTRGAARRRLGLLAAGHWSVVLVIIVGNALLHAHALVTEEFANSSIANQLWRSFTFRSMPDNVDILPMYLFFIFLGGFVWAPLLRKGRVEIVIAVSLTMYVASEVGDGLPWLLKPFAVLAWQALFTAGMVTGWYSTEARALRRRTHPASLIVAIALPVIVGLLARNAIHSRIPDQYVGTVDFLINKLHLGPLNLLAGLGLVVAGAVIVGGIEQRGHGQRSLGWLALLGRRSLACYLAISLLAWVAHVLPASAQESWHREVVVLVGLGITTIVAIVRDRIGARKASK